MTEASSPGPRRTTVTIAVLTYRRPADLDVLLPLLVDQVARQGSHGDLVGVLVVDNDPAASAADTVHALADRSAPVDVRYAHEATPGIAAARNRALREASTDVLVFIDDDERPSQDWLSLLLATFHRYASTAVVGPVISEYEVAPDPWILAGGFFQRRRMPTGSEIDMAGTGNLLLDLREVRRMGLHFDAEFGISGGTDTMFTMQLRQAGGRIVWCDEASVVDAVPAERLTRRWVLRRAYRYGNTWSLVHLKLVPQGRHRRTLQVRLLTMAAARVTAGLARAALGTATRSQAHQARGLRTFARGAGLVMGVRGSAYLEYRRPVSG